MATASPIDVLIETQMVTVDGQERPSRFVVTTTSGYRAELTACLRDECAAWRLTPCLKPDNHITAVDAWLKHSATHCHGWHSEKVKAFAEQTGKPAPRPAPRATRILVKPWQPKHGDPGTRIEYLDDDMVSRTGVVWSEGPVPSSRWVLPDHDAQRPVAVKLPTGRAAVRGELAQVIETCSLDYQHDVIRRCDNIYRAGGVFAVEEHTVSRGGYGYATEIVKRIGGWHAAAECPDAAGKKRYEHDGWKAWKPATEIIPVLLGRAPVTWGSLLCRRCVYLTEPGMAVAA